MLFLDTTANNTLQHRNEKLFLVSGMNSDSLVSFDVISTVSSLES